MIKKNNNITRDHPHSTQAGKVPSHPTLGGPRTISRPLYQHPNDIAPSVEPPYVEQPTDTPAEPPCSPLSHSAATDRGSGPGLVNGLFDLELSFIILNFQF